MPAQIGLPLRNRRGRQLCVERLEKVRLTDIDLLELRMTYRFEIRLPGKIRRERFQFRERHLVVGLVRVAQIDRKSTRLNSSHVAISYAVFCLKKKKKKRILNML